MIDQRTHPTTVYINAHSKVAYSHHSLSINQTIPIVTKPPNVQDPGACSSSGVGQGKTQTRASLLSTIVAE
jgi:hypothetical protein